MASTHADQLRDARLYFVCDTRREQGDLVELLEGALRGGVDVIQLRDKDAAPAELRAAAKTFRIAASSHRVPFILNDDPELAVEVGADGVHVGQGDASLGRARETVGIDRIVGLSTHDASQLAAAHDSSVRPDYLSVGPVWETPTKPGRPAAGLDYLRHAARESVIPWFAIGSIDAETVGTVRDAGAERIVVVRAIRDVDHPEAAARGLSAAVAGGVEATGTDPLESAADSR